MIQKVISAETDNEFVKNPLKNNDNSERLQQEVKNILNGSISKIQQQLQMGKLIISDKKSAEKQLLYIKQNHHRKEMELLNNQIEKNDEMFKKAKRQQLKQMKAEKLLSKGKNEIKIKEVREKVKKWEQLQKQIKEKHAFLQQIKKKKQIEQQERLKKEQQQQKSFQKLQKQKHIQKNIMKIEQNKLKREQTIKNGENLIQQLHPKFLDIQNKFKQFQEQIRFEEEILKKNHKISMKIDHTSIKAHQRQYMTKVQERKLNQNSEGSPRSADGTRQNGFNPFQRDQEITKKQMQKLKRRKQFQQKLKEIPIIIDEAKKVKVQIEIDKGKNRMKYNFLGQKALNDFQIYGQFRDFEINVNAREIGKQYLKELPTITQSSRITKSLSVNSLKQRQVSEKVKYRDYLQDLKMSRVQKVEKGQDQIRSIINNHKSKSKAILQLSQKSKKYELEAKIKLGQMQNYNGLRSVLKKSKEVDGMYLKSIKAKLACLEMCE